jgi:membrane-anchored glycerophosphoryl diester phosphodiesterase (GDPDase)
MQNLKLNFTQTPNIYNKRTLMRKFFSQLFDDDNSINEKSVVGFIAFLMLVIALAVDLITGAYGKPLLINKFIFDGFMVIVLGSFGIASVDKWINKKNDKDEE